MLACAFSLPNPEVWFEKSSGDTDKPTTNVLTGPESQCESPSPSPSQLQSLFACRICWLLWSSCLPLVAWCPLPLRIHLSRRIAYACNWQKAMNFARQVHANSAPSLQVLLTLSPSLFLFLTLCVVLLLSLSLGIALSLPLFGSVL